LLETTATANDSLSLSDAPCRDRAAIVPMTAMPLRFVAVRKQGQYAEQPLALSSFAGGSTARPNVAVPLYCVTDLATPELVA